MNKRWIVVEEVYEVYIRDSVSYMNLCSLAWGMMGVKSSSIQIAQKICDWLNTTDIKLEPWYPTTKTTQHPLPSWTLTIYLVANGWPTHPLCPSANIRTDVWRMSRPIIYIGSSRSVERTTWIVRGWWLISKIIWVPYVRSSRMGYGRDRRL